MPRTLAFQVEGVPAPQGSKTPIPYLDKRGRPRVKLVDSANLSTKSGQRLKRWRTTVASTARVAFSRRDPFRGAVRLTCQFLFDRPASHLTQSGALRAGKPKHATSLRLGDLSKLIRAVEDSLTDAGVWTDDSHVVAFGGDSWKRYCNAGEFPGARVLVEEIPDDVDL